MGKQKYKQCRRRSSSSSTSSSSSSSSSCSSGDERKHFLKQEKKQRKKWKKQMMKGMVPADEFPAKPEGGAYPVCYPPPGPSHVAMPYGPPLNATSRTPSSSAQPYPAGVPGAVGTVYPPGVYQPPTYGQEPLLERYLEGAYAGPYPLVQHPAPPTLSEGSPKQYWSGGFALPGHNQQ